MDEIEETLYNILKKEFKKRQSVPRSNWIVSEQLSMWEAARDYSKKHRIGMIGMSEIKKLRDQAIIHTDQALGHASFSSEWSRLIAEKLKVAD